MSPAPPRPTAIITDGLWRKSLSAIRSLGKAGYDITVIGDSPFTTGFWSRFCRRRITAPTAATDPAAFGAALLAELDRLHARGQRPVLLPMEDPSLSWVSQNLPRLEGHAHLLLPPPASLAVALNKAATIAAAQALGLPCPKTHEPKSADEFATLAAQQEPGRFVVKPRSGTGSAGIAYDQRPHVAWRRHWDQFGPMLIQERIPPSGRGQGVSLLLDAGSRPLAAFAHQRLQQYPNSGGPSTDRVSIHAPDLIDMSLRLVQSLHWRGIAMVEWKIDPRDNQPKLMEINPRFWGSLELAIRAGIDFPALYARAAAGESLPPPAPYPAGVRCRWMIPGEILRYLSQPRQNREALPAFLRGLPGLAEEWDPQDLPGAAATLLCTAALALNPRYWKYARRR